ERALGQEIGAAELLGLLLEHLDEQAADGLALLFGIGLAFQRRDEAVRSIDQDQRQIVVLAEHLHHALIHEAVGDQLTCILVDHGLMRKDEAESV
ncbi:cytosine deaminase, partial [Mesorhizobium sp. M2D.F.Ca.ET.147.01.1.1]